MNSSKKTSILGGLSSTMINNEGKDKREKFLGRGVNKGSHGNGRTPRGCRGVGESQKVSVRGIWRK